MRLLVNCFSARHYSPLAPAARRFVVFRRLFCSSSSSDVSSPPNSTIVESSSSSNRNQQQEIAEATLNDSSSIHSNNESHNYVKMVQQQYSPSIGSAAAAGAKSGASTFTNSLQRYNNNFYYNSGGRQLPVPANWKETIRSNGWSHKESEAAYELTVRTRSLRQCHNLLNAIYMTSSYFVLDHLKVSVKSNQMTISIPDSITDYEIFASIRTMMPLFRQYHTDW